LFEAYFSLVVFSFLLLGSPGPAPLAIAATSAVFGIRKGFNFLFGLVTGFGLVLLIQGAAVFWVVGENQHIMWVLQLFGFLYILYIAYKIACSPIIDEKSVVTSPPGFIDGMVLNISNPKAYAAMTAINSQALLPYDDQKWAYTITGLVCFVVVVLIDLAWLLLGQFIRPLMQHPSSGRKVRVLFATSMVVVVIWIMINNII